MFALLDTAFAPVVKAAKTAWNKVVTFGTAVTTSVRGIVGRTADSRSVRAVRGACRALATKCVALAERACQKVLGWFGCDWRRRQVAADKQVAVDVARKLIDVYRGTYTTAIQAEAAIQSYRGLYKQITLPEVRVRLLPPQELFIVAVDDHWKVTDRATARTARALRDQSQAGCRNEQRTNGMSCGSSR